MQYWYENVYVISYNITAYDHKKNIFSPNYL